MEFNIKNCVIDAVSHDKEIEQLNIFPNASNRTFKISTLEYVTVTVFSADGHVVYSEESSSNQVRLEDLSKGVYFVQLTGENGITYSNKVVVE